MHLLYNCIGTYPLPSFLKVTKSGCKFNTKSLTVDSLLVHHFRVQTCRVAVLSGVQCIPYCVQRAKLANDSPLISWFLCLLTTSKHSVQNVRWQAVWELTVINLQEGNAQCIAVSVNHRLVFFSSYNGALLCGIVFPDSPVLDHMWVVFSSF